jgi:hypothetical protein
MSDKEYTPFKCPDCKVWWRGETHKCEPPRVAVTVKPGVTVEDTGGGFVIKPTPYTPYVKPAKCKICNVPLENAKAMFCFKHKNKKWDKGHGHGYNEKTPW